MSIAIRRLLKNFVKGSDNSNEEVPILNRSTTKRSFECYGVLFEGYGSFDRTISKFAKDVVIDHDLGRDNQFGFARANQLQQPNYLVTVDYDASGDPSWTITVEGKTLKTANNYKLSLKTIDDLDKATGNPLMRALKSLMKQTQQASIA